MGEPFHRSAEGNSPLGIVDWSRGTGHFASWLAMMADAVEDWEAPVTVYSHFTNSLRRLRYRGDPAEDRVGFRSLDDRMGALGSDSSRFQKRWIPFWEGVRIRRELKAEGGTPFLFFACLMHWDHLGLRWFCRGARLPWSGLLLSFKAHRTGWGDLSLLENARERQCTGVMILDENRCPWFEERLPGKRVTALPDTARTEAEEHDPVRRDLLAKAQGRPIVLLIGLLRRYKGVMDFVELARFCAGKEWFFAMVGTIHWPDFTEEERVQLQSEFASSTKGFAHFEPIGSEEGYNGIFQCASVIWCAYRDFQGSANTLTKAGLCRIPAVVRRGYLLEERVKRYRIGKVFEGDSPHANARVLEELLELASWRKEGNWERFAEDFSESRWRRTFASFLRGGPPNTSLDGSG